MKKVLIIGATSAIAMACARLWAQEGAEFFLVGRNIERLGQSAADLTPRHASRVHIHSLDLNDFAGHAKMIESCFDALGTVDIVLVAHGTLPDQKACEQDVDLALTEFSSNGLSLIALLTLLANRMEAQRHGTIAVISSVAGDRGRASNYLYGTAKAAVTTFCEGLRARLFRSGVHVMTIKPGFVDTPMTKGLRMPAVLLATPERVARDIKRGIERASGTMYTPRFWALIMFVIKSIPGSAFKRLKL
jgi:decaprenylphospho-beta-D-erythro-pentofuranosid-2-ulose 2-reductase